MSGFNCCKLSLSTQTVKAKLTLVADGCFSRFRKGLTNACVSVSSHFVGLIMHNCPQYKPGHAELVFGTRGPPLVLIYQISSDCTRMLVDVPGKMPSNLKDYLEAEIGPQLPGDVPKQLSFELKTVASCYMCRIRSLRLYQYFSWSWKLCNHIPL